MNHSFFESLTQQDAREHLQGFLLSEKKALEAMDTEEGQGGFRLDYTLASLSPTLKWILGRIEVRRVPVPATEPAWVREFHKDGLIDFPLESSYLLLRASYYLGECFVQANNSLFWTIGNPELIEKNMPVVAGFVDGDEMSPIMVCENVFGRILGDGFPTSEIDKMIETWRRLMPVARTQ